MSRATLSDLVEMLRIDLGYGEEFSVNTEAGLLYDIDETENLGKKFSELGLSLCKTYLKMCSNFDTGIRDDTFLTVIDDDEEEPRVNLILIIQET